MLIVEDNARMRSALRDYLQLAYPVFNIFEAVDGAAAFDLCRERPFRVVLLDVGLPDANGIDLIAPIRALRPDCAVVVVSQHVDRSYTERARAAGACAYVTKHAVFRELMPVIDRALGVSGSR